MPCVCCVVTNSMVCHWFIRHSHVDKGDVYGAEDYASRMKRVGLSPPPPIGYNIRQKIP